MSFDAKMTMLQFFAAGVTLTSGTNYVTAGQYLFAAVLFGLLSVNLIILAYRAGKKELI